jgi:hypothetical protein
MAEAFKVAVAKATGLPTATAPVAGRKLALTVATSQKAATSPVAAIKVTV